MTRNIRRVEVPHAFSDAILSDNTIVVMIDVYLFSSTVLTLFHHNISQVIPVYNSENIAELKQEEDNILAGGEEDALLNDNLDADLDFANTPQSVFATFGVMDETPEKVALTSNNGAKRCIEIRDAIVKNDYQECHVLIGGSMNAKAVADYINTHYPEHNVLLVCAGSKGEATIEDVIGALAITQYLRNENVPVAEYEEIISLLPAGKMERENGFPWLSDEDVDHISTLNKFDIVPKFNFQENAFEPTQHNNT